MKNSNWLFLTFVLLALMVASGCGVIDTDRSQDSEILVETYVAQTQSAQNILATTVARTLTAIPATEEFTPGGDITPTPQTTQTALTTVMPSETPTLSPMLTNTPMLTIPLAEVSVATNCRTGPGKIYDQISVLNVGRQVEVVGKNTEGTYWVVKNPGGSGTCWLWDQYAKIIGPTANLPLWDTPPTPTPIAGVTPTLAAVTLKVNVPTNCRIGPGKAYEKISVLQPGKTVKVVARHATADFWVIENPEGTGTCWLWGEYAKFTGIPGNLPVQTAPPTPTPQAGVTQTPTGVSLKVSVDTNCRTGPGKSYDIVTVLQIGKTANVVGRHISADYWVIENPVGNGTCWVWGEYASFTGTKANLPVWDVPPTPTPASVTLKVSVDTHCRIGPGIPYDIVTILRIGKTAEVIGRNSEKTYWVIRNPAGSGYCWVWGKYATLSGPTGSLPVWDPPATPTPGP